MVVPEGTRQVGTATVRESARPTMTTAQRRIFEATGNRPQVDSTFDEIAGGVDPFAQPPLSLGKPKKAPKYRNTKCEHEGIKFDSQRERSRWFHLVQEQAAGRIRDLRLQVKFNLVPTQKRADGTAERAVDYIADFVYRDAAGVLVVEDVKSEITRKNPTYGIKRKLMLERHGITIQEVI